MTEESASWFSDSKWPMLEILIPNRPMSDEELSAGYKQMEAKLALGTHVVLIDPEDKPHLTAAQRKYVAEFNQRHADLFRKNCLGIAVVVKNRLMRGVVTAIDWLKPPPFKRELFSSRADAIAWLNQRWKEHTGETHKNIA